jgi:class 3 adenylate cyclase
MFTGFVVIGGASFGLALFDRRPVLLGVAAFFGIITATTLAEQLRLIPYAPLMLEAPFQDQRLDPSWLVTIGTVDLASVLVILVLVDNVIDRWKSDERQLAQTGDQLAKANEIISRYIASQLAQRILAGDYDVAERHARRRLTLFFSDIRGFAEIADTIEPEDLSEMLNEYLSEMTTIADRYGGTIDKFIGDAVMIFFGAPVPLDDGEQASRAIRMGMDMQRRLGELRAAWRRRGFEHPFEIRIGINTGQVSIGNFGSKGRMDYTAIGRQVNLAARLQSHCEPGKILLSHSTWALVQDEFTCTPRGEIQVKGFHAPVKVYEVVGPAIAEGTASPAAGSMG